jgi:hypothetical protein
LEERTGSDGEDANWIGGVWRSALAGGSFAAAGVERADRAGAADAGSSVRRRGRRWPRSGTEDLARARGEAGDGPRAWSALEPRRRRALLEDALVLLAPRFGTLGREIGLALEDDAGVGLGPDAVRVECRAGRGEGREAPEEAPEESREASRREAPPDPLADLLRLAGAGAPGSRAPDPEAEGAPDPAGTFRLVRVAAAEGLAGLCRAVLEGLVSGGAVLLVSDPAWPAAARALAGALDEAGLPPGALSLLHDDGRTVLRAALGRSDLAGGRVSGSPEWLASLRRAATGDAQPFGAGVLEQGTSTLEWSSPVNRTALVLAGEDPAAAARTLVERSFGAAAAFCGQRAGQVGRAVVHQRLFSALTAAVLEAVDALGPPAALLDPGLARELEERLRLGLDEGATLLRGSPGRLAGSRGEGGRGILSPCVFTNVEPAMRLAAARRPAPVLCLLRATDDAAARSAARELDHPAPPRRTTDPSLRP